MTVEILEWLYAVALLGASAPLVIYPLTLVLLSNLFRKTHAIGDALPTVTLVISAFNEANVIEAKLDNALSLDYPRELLEVMVISDSSDDATDEKVRLYADRGVKLYRQTVRGGKSRALTAFVPRATGTILVFSDANSMYESNAIRRLVRHFSDSTIGYVVGHQRFYRQDGSAVADSEGLYWDLEVRLKEWESSLSSVVGGDGAIYAIRAPLFKALEDSDINDFLNPLQIVARGYRGVFDREAFCYEHSARSFAGEFRRKSRIVNRSLQAVLKVPQVLNPFRVGWFAYQLFTHKVLRWFMPYFLMALLLTSVALTIVQPFWLYTITSFGFAFLFLAALLRAFPATSELRFVYLAYFFLLGNAAALLGTWRLLRGQRVVVWAPER